jgi:hypothetical protein
VLVEWYGQGSVVGMLLKGDCCWSGTDREVFHGMVLTGECLWDDYYGDCWWDVIYSGILRG